MFVMMKAGKKSALVIGSGFSGLSAACYLAKDGYQVTVIEKNEQIGGRAREWEQDGFKLDMGPSWYWMPDVFDDFFKDFGKKTSDYYKLIRLNPSYRVFFLKEFVMISLQTCRSWNHYLNDLKLAVQKTS